MNNTFLFLILLLAAASSYAQQDFIDSRIITTGVRTNIFDRKATQHIGNVDF